MRLIKYLLLFLILALILIGAFVAYYVAKNPDNAPSFEEIISSVDGSAEGQAAPTPAAGSFVEVEMSKYFAPDVTEFDYEAPLGIGTLHEVVVPASGLTGKDALRTYHAMGATSGEPRPAIILLHGFERNGRAMLDMWQLLAEREGFVLLAPDAVNGEWALSDGDAFIRDILLPDAQKRYAIDPAKIYVSGHSAGGKLAFHMANGVSGPWRAVSVHGASADKVSTASSTNPPSVVIYIGEDDDSFPLDEVRTSAQQLSQAGHDVSLNVIPGHGHWYYAIGPRLAMRTWEQFQALE